MEETGKEHLTYGRTVLGEEVKILDAILAFLEKEPAIAIIGFLGAILAALIQRNRDLTYRNAKKALKSRIRSDYKETGREPVFFETGTSKRIYKLYWKNVVVEKVPLWDFGLQKPEKRLNWKESSTIKGDAGIGKTIFVENLFRSFNSPLRRWKEQVLLRRYCVKTTFRELSTDASFRDMLHNVKCRRLCLLVDGFDELSEQDAEMQKAIKEFLTFLRHLSHCKKKSVLLFGRTAFIDKYLQPHTEFCSIFHACYELRDWSDEMLKSYDEKLMDLYLSEEQQEKKSQIQQLMNSPTIRECLGNNPLRHKMMLYICIYQEGVTKGYEELLELKEQYQFYTRFLEIMVKREWNRMFDFPAEDEEIQMVLNAHSEIAFYRFQKKPLHEAKLFLPERMKETRSTREILKTQPVFNTLLMYRNSEEGEEYQYIHKTFEEYLVARNLHRRIKEAFGRDTGKMILLAKALMQTYSNDYADFITSGFRTLSEKKVQDVFLLMERVYDHTLCETGQKGRLDAEFLKFIRKLEDYELLHLKYEIVFLAGRLRQTIVKEFLRKIYRNDDLTKYKNRHLKKYQNVILKRCCAISASLIGDEETEVDYVKRMIPETASYDRDYDLVNRSHTLIYYNDVVCTEFFDYQDLDPQVPWTNARSKRIGRLSKKPKGPNDKYTHFRAFDLATIYTFLSDRPESISQLSEKEKRILRECIVDIEGISIQKRELMRELKNKIVKMIE